VGAPGKVARFKQQLRDHMTPEDVALYDAALAVFAEAKMHDLSDRRAQEMADQCIEDGLSARGREPVEPGDVVLIDERIDQFGGCFMVVEKVTDEKIVGLVYIPGRLIWKWYCRPSECRRVGSMPSDPTTSTG
jgi:hypothetical protein